MRRGIWKPCVPEPVELVEDPTFHEFDTGWFNPTEGEWRETTQLGYE
jgi:hypothetical protein